MSAFVPTHDWQDVPEGATLPPGCQIRMDIQSGRQQARIAPNGEAVEPADHEDHARPNGPVKGDALLDLSHDGLALALGRRWQRKARYVALWSKWLFWTRSHWSVDDKLHHMTLARAYLRKRADALVRAATSGKIPKLSAEQAEGAAKALRSAPMVANVTRLARSNRELVAIVPQWDADALNIGTKRETT